MVLIYFGPADFQFFFQKFFSLKNLFYGVFGVADRESDVRFSILLPRLPRWRFSRGGAAHRSAREEGQTRGVLLQTKKFFVKNAIKIETRRNFRVGGCKFPTAMGLCRDMEPRLTVFLMLNPEHSGERGKVIFSIAPKV